MIGRWLSVDPLAHLAPDMTPYHYTHNNPLNRIDPDGRSDTRQGEDEHHQETKQLVQHYDDLIVISPVEDPTISSPQGNRTHPITGKTKLHKGVDIVDVNASKTDGKAIVAPANGVVTLTETDNGKGTGSGNATYIKADGNGDVHANLHAKGAPLPLGTRVTRGQKIGEIGSTGGSTGSHLHYQIRNSKGALMNAASRNPGLNGAPSTKDARRDVKIDAANNNRTPGHSRIY